MLPWYFMLFKIVPNDNGEMKLGKRDGIGHREAKVNKPQSPKSNLLCTSDHSTQDSTAPCPLGRGKGRIWGAEWAKEAKVLINPLGVPGHLYPSTFPSALSTFILTISPVESMNESLVHSEANICQLFLILGPWVKDKMLFHQRLFILTGSSEGSTGKKMLTELGRGTEHILNRQLLKGNS